jgi:hypothetical protein
MTLRTRLSLTQLWTQTILRGSLAFFLSQQLYVKNERCCSPVCTVSCFCCPQVIMSIGAGEAAWRLEKMLNVCRIASGLCMAVALALVLLMLYGADCLAAQEVSPQYIVVYDPDLAAIRQIEVGAVDRYTWAYRCTTYRLPRYSRVWQVFKAGRPGIPLRVYFLCYEASVEEQKYVQMLAFLFIFLIGFACGEILTAACVCWQVSHRHPQREGVFRAVDTREVGM